MSMLISRHVVYDCRCMSLERTMSILGHFYEVFAASIYCWSMSCLPWGWELGNTSTFWAEKWGGELSTFITDSLTECSQSLFLCRSPWLVFCFWTKQGGHTSKLRVMHHKFSFILATKVHASEQISTYVFFFKAPEERSFFFLNYAPVRYYRYYLNLHLSRQRCELFSGVMMRESVRDSFPSIQWKIRYKKTGQNVPKIRYESHLWAYLYCYVNFKGFFFLRTFFSSFFLLCR